MNSLTINTLNDIISCIWECDRNKSSSEEPFLIKGKKIKITNINARHEVVYKNRIIFRARIYDDKTSNWYYDNEVESLIFNSKPKTIILNNDIIEGEEVLKIENFLDQNDDDLFDMYFNLSTKGITLMPEEQFKVLCSLKHIMKANLNSGSFKAYQLYTNDFLEFCNVLDENGKTDMTIKNNKPSAVDDFYRMYQQLEDMSKTKKNPFPPYSKF